MVEKASKENLNHWVNLSFKLFTDSKYEELYMEYEEFLNSKKEIGFLYKIDNKYIGFINISKREDYVNGATISPVIFIEAIYVIPEYRDKGIGKYLVNYIEDYAKSIDIYEIISDCNINNIDGQNFHKKLGFLETERVVYYKKEIKNEE